MNKVVPIELSPEAVEELRKRLSAKDLREEDYEVLEKVLLTMEALQEASEEKGASIKRLLRMIFGPKTERRQDVLGPDAATAAQEDASGGDGDAAPSPTGAAGGEATGEDRAAKPKRRGHGRHGADDYTGAERKVVRHESLKPGDPCPLCPKGKVYRCQNPGKLVRLVGKGPIQATIIEPEKLRCNLCGEVFTAKVDAQDEEKVDATAGAMIALLKYGNGFPFYRLGQLQDNQGVPLPAATQWDILKRAVKAVYPMMDELIRQAAQGKVIHNDDTTMKVLALMKKAKEKRKKGERTGVFTTGMLSRHDGHKIALFFTGPKHAGENLDAVLEHRAKDQGPPIQMCDGLDRNLPQRFKTILANCIAHSRRKYVELAESFPAETKYVIDTLADVYKNDDLAEKHQLTPQERLAFHQEHSDPLMADLCKWMEDQVEQKKVEPNSRLGEAIMYMKKRWTQLTLFLREPGAPLDNNLCEQTIKRVILLRKNSYFYKTLNGARVGDTFMSVIHTCVLNRVSAFKYLTELQRHANDVEEHPHLWLPWHYQDRLAAIHSPPAS